MPKELDFEELTAELEQLMSPEQREWLAHLMHDHVSGLVSSLSMHVEIVSKMISRGMDVTEELASLKENVTNASTHIRGIERAIRPNRD
jgi:hypothetical protein